MDVGEVINPIDHDLATVVRRYLGIKMDKAKTKLGGSDWGIPDLSPPHCHYMKADVTCLPPFGELSRWNYVRHLLTRSSGSE